MCGAGCWHSKAPPPHFGVFVVWQELPHKYAITQTMSVLLVQESQALPRDHEDRCYRATTDSHCLTLAPSGANSVGHVQNCAGYITINIRVP